MWEFEHIIIQNDDLTNESQLQTAYWNNVLKIHYSNKRFPTEFRLLYHHLSKTQSQPIICDNCINFK